MKRIGWAVLALFLCLTACAPVPPSGDGPVEGYTFTDDLGREVTVASVERVAALTGSFADIWCLAGGGDTLVAAAHDSWTSFDLRLGEDVTDLGGIKEPNLERLLAAEPDLVLASSNTAAQAELAEAFEQMGLTTAYFNVTNVEEYLRMLKVCTDLTGAEENYRLYGLDLLDQVERARDRVDGSAPTVLYVRATGSSCKVKNSRDTVLGEMLADLGCVNLADSTSGLLEDLSLEVILQEDPDHIFLVLQGAEPAAAQDLLNRTLLSNPAWQSLTAVREGRCHVMDHRLYNLKPNGRWGEAYERLAEILYPN